MTKDTTQPMEEPIMPSNKTTLRQRIEAILDKYDGWMEEVYTSPDANGVDSSNEYPQTHALDDILAQIEAHTQAEVERALEKQEDAIEDALDDIQGTANKGYFPFMEDQSRLDHIDSEVDELRATLKKGE